MPPQLAAIICISLFSISFGWIFKKNNGPSIALWVLWSDVYSWITISCSWLNLSAPIVSVDAYAEGNPVNLAVFLSLIVAGAFILSRRKIDWGLLLSQNKWIVLYFLYCLSSITWTDEPFVLFKR